ncbi:MAG: hypothetical protein AVDCRST_MAG53-962, partial [uncultured Solirubrobacteraceae bacterium]
GADEPHSRRACRRGRSQHRRRGSRHGADGRAATRRRPGPSGHRQGRRRGAGGSPFRRPGPHGHQARKTHQVHQEPRLVLDPLGPAQRHARRPDAGQGVAAAREGRSPCPVAGPGRRHVEDGGARRHRPARCVATAVHRGSPERVAHPRRLRRRCADPSRRPQSRNRERLPPGAGVLVRSGPLRWPAGLRGAPLPGNARCRPQGAAVRHEAHSAPPGAECPCGGGRPRPVCRLARVRPHERDAQPARVRGHGHGPQHQV